MSDTDLRPASDGVMRGDGTMTEYYQYNCCGALPGVDGSGNGDNNSSQEGADNDEEQGQGCCSGSRKRPCSSSCCCCAAEAWRFTDVGEVSTHSRDGSVHATDEVFNASSHLAATLLSLLGTALLVSESSALGDAWKIVSFSIYGASLTNLFLCSALHHGIVSSPRVEYCLRLMDYLAIYPLIAGTFTPLCLVLYHDDVVGWTFFGSTWLIAVAGMVGTVSCFHKLPKWLSMTMYVTLGWFGACMTYWLIPKIGHMGMFWLLLGGICYTVGGYIYTTEHPNPYPGVFGFHEIWHVAVIFGAFFHYVLMYFYVLPYQPS